MADTAKRDMTEVESLRAELEEVKLELAQVKAINKQYEEAYSVQGERYNNLFGLLANTIEYVVSGSGTAKRVNG